jgi:hypothetical protein
VHVKCAEELGGLMTSTTPDAGAIVRQMLDAFLAGDVEAFMSFMERYSSAPRAQRGVAVGDLSDAVLCR